MVHEEVHAFFQPNLKVDDFQPNLKVDDLYDHFPD